MGEVKLPPAESGRSLRYLFRSASHQLPSTGTVRLEDLPEPRPRTVTHLWTNTRRRAAPLSLTWRVGELYKRCGCGFTSQEGLKRSLQSSSQKLSRGHS